MVNFGPLAAEIFSLVWGTPGNFNGFRFLAALLHGTLVVGCLFVARIQATDFDLESFRLIGRRSISCATLTSLTFRDLSTRMTDRFAVDVALFCNSYLWSEGDPLLYLECVCGPLLIWAPRLWLLVRLLEEDKECIPVWKCPNIYPLFSFMCSLQIHRIISVVLQMAMSQAGLG